MTQVKLNKIEQAIVDKLPQEARGAVVSTILAEKQAKAERANSNRKNFRMVLQSSGALSVYGLGRQFPTSLYKGEWETLIANIEVIKAEVAKMK